MSKANATTSSASGVVIEADISGDWEFQSDGVTKLVLKKDGRLYGVALHNNANAVTGTTNQYIASGTWSPSTTIVTGLTSISATGNGQWLRVGNVVSASCEIGSVSINSASSASFAITLPIASTFTGASDCNGVARSRDNNLSMAVYGSSTFAYVQANGTVPTGTTSLQISFQYTIK